MLKTGVATITMKKNGDITIEGKQITIKASGDVIIKGAKNPSKLSSVCTTRGPAIRLTGENGLRPAADRLVVKVRGFSQKQKTDAA